MTHSFYLFEGSFFQGGGGWEEVHVLNNPTNVKKVVAAYLKAGTWVHGYGDDFTLCVYQGGVLAWEEDLYQFLRLKVPGLTEIRFNVAGTVDRIELEPGSKYRELFEDSIFDEQDSTERAEALWELLSEEFDTMGDDASFGVDWDSIQLPELIPPVLPEGARARVTVQAHYGPRELTYGFNTCL
ncbi:hypothetical protein SAZ11_07500 [Streptomyces sp. FXJ1.4098]|nr:hypothetical protein [Streptomyces sp. FXJ1.4098]